MEYSRVFYIAFGRVPSKLLEPTKLVGLTDLCKYLKCGIAECASVDVLFCSKENLHFSILLALWVAIVTRPLICSCIPSLHHISLA